MAISTPSQQDKSKIISILHVLCKNSTDSSKIRTLIFGPKNTYCCRLLQKFGNFSMFTLLHWQIALRMSCVDNFRFVSQTTPQTCEILEFDSRKIFRFFLNYISSFKIIPRHLELYIHY